MKQEEREGSVRLPESSRGQPAGTPAAFGTHPPKAPPAPRKPVKRRYRPRQGRAVPEETRAWPWVLRASAAAWHQEEGERLRPKGHWCSGEPVVKHGSRSKSRFLVTA
jgi:hypothetical protein